RGQRPRATAGLAFTGRGAYRRSLAQTALRRPRHEEGHSPELSHDPRRHDGRVVLRNALDLWRARRDAPARYRPLEPSGVDGRSAADFRPRPGLQIHAEIRRFWA